MTTSPVFIINAVTLRLWIKMKGDKKYSGSFICLGLAVLCLNVV